MTKRGPIWDLTDWHRARKKTTDMGPVWSHRVTTGGQDLLTDGLMYLCLLTSGPSTV